MNLERIAWSSPTEPRTVASKSGPLHRSLWMSRRMLSWLIAANLVLQPLGWSAANAANADAANQVGRAPSLATSASTAQVRVSDAYGKLPLSFEANRGQTDPQVKFLSRGGRHVLFLTPTETVLVLTTPKQAAKDESPSIRGKPGRPEEGTRTVLRMTFTGANPTPRITGLEALPGKANYFIGNDPAKWQTNVPTYAKVRYEELYPGIDLVYYGTHRQLEYDFVVRPGADPSRIALEFTGANRLELDPAGDLVMHTAAGQIRQRKPVIYQEVEGVRKEIPGGYAVRGSQEVGFRVAAYESGRPLVIDPTLDYSTFLGGSSSDQGLGIAVDANGGAYVTGKTSSLDFPTTVGAFDMTFGGGTDAFVTKLDPSGSTLVYSAYLGGISTDEGRGIAVDAAGNAYVTGKTASLDFPTTVGAFDRTLGGSGDAFVTKLDPSGSTLVYSTFLGGTFNEDQGNAIAVDGTGNAYVTGETFAGGGGFFADFPVTPGAFQTSFNTFGIQTQAFVTKLNPSGSGLVYSTYLGNGTEARGFGIAVDATGNAYVTGSGQNGFAVTSGAFDTTFNGGLIDAFVTKLNAGGSALVYSTFLGGSGNDEGFGIAVDGNGSAYVTGKTGSLDFPMTVGAFHTTSGGGTDAFVTKLDPSGSALVYSTFLGGNNTDEGHGIALDAAGSAYVTGVTASADFPVTAGTFDATFGGNTDAFVAKINPSGSALVYSTYLGGANQDQGNGIAVDATPSAYVTGYTFSDDFPVTSGALQSVRRGDFDAFVAKISEDTTPPSVSCGSPDGLWHSSDVSIPCTASDSGSGLANPADASFSLVTNVPAGTEDANASTNSHQVCDNAGNCSTAGPIAGNKVDKKPPTVSCNSPDGGWHAGDVSIPCTARDSGSGLANSSDASFSLVTSVPAGTEDANASTDSRQVCDNAGNCSTAGPIAGNKVDKKRPSISIAAPASGGVYLLNAAVAASYGCSDGGSGVASCSGPVLTGNTIDTQSVGSKSFTVAASDAVGNSNTQTVNYVVAYDVVLLYDPAKPGKMITLKLQDANGVNVSNPAIVLTVQSIDSTPTSGTFTFVKRPPSYKFTVNTAGLASGQHTLKFTAGSDPTVHSAPFTVR